MQPLRKVIHSHPRLFIGLGTGILVAYLVPPDLDAVTRFLLGWNGAVWTYLILIAVLMTRASPARVKTSAENEDEAASVVLLLVCVAAVASLVAIILELANTRHLQAGSNLLRYGLTALTLAGSWLLVATMFTLHYARLFYDAAGKLPLRFPDGTTNPDYWDFLYFSFTIAVAVQTADVSIMSRTVRKAVLMQAVLTFFFNTAVLGLSVNIAAGLVGS